MKEEFSIVKYIRGSFFIPLLFLLINGIVSAQDVRYIKDFGAKKNSSYNNTRAFQKAAEWLSKNGGTLIIDPGVYLVGKQLLTRNYSAGSAYLDDPILLFNNVQQPIVIKGYGAKIKAIAGLKYGSFNPVTGKKDSLRKEGNRSSYYSSAFTFINAINCSSISIAGIELDGNCSKLDIGPSFGPEGIQLSATGIRLYGNQTVNISDCNIHHCALDGILIGWPNLKDTAPLYPHVIKNVKSTFNGRQGISWVGGNSLQVFSSDFSSTGQAVNQGLKVVSKPSAGIDIEIEESIIKNGIFYGCTVYNNSGPGLSSIGHDTYDVKFIKCKFVGTVNSAAYPKSQGFSFDSCFFVGKVERIFGSKDKKKAIAFKHCIFTMDNKQSPNKKVFGDYCEFYEGSNVIFENCVFDAANKRLPVFNNQEITFISCVFKQNSSFDFKASAYFLGNTTMVLKGSGLLDKSEAHFEGKCVYNGKQITN